MSDTAKIIDPKQWRVRGSLRHGGFVYGPGEPLPELTEEEALHYEKVGSLMRLDENGEVRSILDQHPDGSRRIPEPPDALAYLYARDEMVLRTIVQHQPKKRLVQEILALAKKGNRSMVLRFALEAILLYGGVKDPHADLPRGK